MKKALVPVLLIAFLTILGCYFISKEYSAPKPHKGYGAPITGSPVAPSEGGGEPSGSGISSSFTAVLIGADYELRTLSLKDPESEKKAELSYDGTTAFLNKFGQNLTARELTIGEILDIVYSDKGGDGEGLIKEAKESGECFTMTGVVKFSVDENKRIFTIAGVPYKYSEDVFIYSDEGRGEWMDINELDTLIVRGKDRDIYSVVVDKGHGYIRILNDSYFVGGWIEVGNEIIKPITEDMLLPAPEGEFHVRLTNKGYLGEEDLSVTRNKETILDLGKIEIEEVAIGHVEFNIEPVYAQLFIDGEITDYEERVPLEYGIHNIKIEAAGYETVTTNIKIGSEYANVDISLDPDDTETAQSGTGSSGPFNGSTRTDPYASSKSAQTTDLRNIQSSGTGSVQTANSPSPVPSLAGTGSGSSTSNIIDIGPFISSLTDLVTGNTSATDPLLGNTNVISNTKKIYVEEPRGTEVYLDGNYIGVAPASTAKVTGTHVITLSRSGYVTKSYTVNIANDGNDITFSFSALNPSE